MQGVAHQFTLEKSFARNPRSDFISDSALAHIGDALRIHHAFSRQALSKDRFEYALEGALRNAGHTVALAPSRTNRGHDMTVDGIAISLKTQADAGIRPDRLHISKFMELGRGEWVLESLRDSFLQHMQSYSRIFQFRCLGQGPAQYSYELVEIPKSLLEEARDAPCVISVSSRQTPQPGYCSVHGADRLLKFKLYFDGGTERKLQIQGLRKDLCTLHATWSFTSTPLDEPQAR